MDGERECGNFSFNFSMDHLLLNLLHSNDCALNYYVILTIILNEGRKKQADRNMSEIPQLLCIIWARLACWKNREWFCKYWAVILPDLFWRIISLSWPPLYWMTSSWLVFPDYGMSKEATMSWGVWSDCSGSEFKSVALVPYGLSGVEWFWLQHPLAVCLALSDLTCKPISFICKMGLITCLKDC